ncbi:ion channel [Ornithinimicrobium cavernae]|uniref:ion channel n=1 Tax=Ornithinimicrobium cavernae TaxID=2666047 RepID=UPI001379BB8A|nr:ion channel [Ornithinimicrobium cavernae]
MAWLLNVLGAVLAIVALRDIFHTVWYPRGYGFLAHVLCRWVWRLTRVWNRHRPDRTTELGGPLGLLVTVSTWTLLIVVGFALIYLPHLPEGFFSSSPLDAEASSGFDAALYVSLMYVSTLGLGDIAPAYDLLRLIVPLQALAGFVLLTSAISWMLQVYPTLSTRRGLALQLSLLDTPETYQMLRTGLPEIASRTLDTVAQGIADCATDMSVYGESYFFRERDQSRALPAQIAVAVRLEQEAARSTSPEVRRSASTLHVAIDELAATVDRDFLHVDGSTQEVLEAFARDHQQPLSGKVP